MTNVNNPSHGADREDNRLHLGNKRINQTEVGQQRYYWTLGAHEATTSLLFRRTMNELLLSREKPSSCYRFKRIVAVLHIATIKHVLRWFFCSKT
jgi:hypothetical protein